ncbi:helix-turn-helix domain-containing protein [Sphaerisporangium sp. NPDC005288]|uniref:AraC-like ligand-binding domain-containing protein n=1 Tax=Sphaerisporangium sp. NPDC005288 TaxID=3155114 RepID=UPI0033AD0A3C
MAIKEFRTESLAPEDRFPSWFEMASSTHVSSRIRSDSEADFQASVRVLDCAEVQISALTHPTVRAERTARLVRQCDPEVYLFQLIVRGGGGLAQNGRSGVFGADHFVIIDSSQPYQGWRSAEDGVNEAVVVQVSRASLGLRSTTVARLAAVPFSAKEGIGAVLAGHLVELMKNACDYTRSDTVALGAVTVDLIAAACAHQLDATACLSPETRQRALLAQIHRFIRDRLADPALTADLIAAAHQISTRYLYKLFRSQDMAVAAWIRHSRLERCRHDLADPALRSRSIQTIATCWGFTDGAHFSRLFRAAYGMSPNDYRHQAGTTTP